MYAGKLSTDQRYLLYTTPTPGYRELLTLAISRPGERIFSHGLRCPPRSGRNSRGRTRVVLPLRGGSL
jgi:hypothetical protein